MSRIEKAKFLLQRLSGNSSLSKHKTSVSFFGRVFVREHNKLDDVHLMNQNGLSHSDECLKIILATCKQPVLFA